MYRIKCPECNSCLKPSGIENGTLIWFCDFCKDRYVLRPGNKLVEYRIFSTSKDNE